MKVRYAAEAEAEATAGTKGSITRNPPNTAVCAASYIHINNPSSTPPPIGGRSSKSRMWVGESKKRSRENLLINTKGMPKGPFPSPQ